MSSAACSLILSSSERELLVPRARSPIRQRRAFSVAGSSIWNGPPLEIRLLPRGNTCVFFKQLKSNFPMAGLGALSNRFLEGAVY